MYSFILMCRFIYVYIYCYYSIYLLLSSVKRAHQYLYASAEFAAQNKASVTSSALPSPPGLQVRIVSFCRNFLKFLYHYFNIQFNFPIFFQCLFLLFESEADIDESHDFFDWNFFNLNKRNQKNMLIFITSVQYLIVTY